MTTHTCFKPILWLGTCLYASTATLAQALTPLVPDVTAPPVVSGNTIMVSEPGWYQFQRADTFEEVCAGVLSCTVDPGLYIVINHTSGSRWEAVRVDDAVSPAGPVVMGNRIVLPGNDWWQVQNAQTFASVCEGREACEVPDGTYIVINHSTGERYESVLVQGSPMVGLELSGERYSASAGELFWRSGSSAAPYQVFREGLLIGSTDGSSFFDDTLPSAAAFDYRVVARTGEEATVNLAAFGSAPATSLHAGNALAILRQVIAVINEEPLDVLFETVQSDLEFQGRTFFLSNTTDDIQFSQSVSVSPPYQLEENYGQMDFVDLSSGSEYTCAGGGQVLSYLNTRSNDQVFDQCAINTRTYHGTTGQRNAFFRGLIARYPFRAFSVQEADGRRTEIDGVYYFGNMSRVTSNVTEGWRDAQFLQPIEGGMLSIDALTVERINRITFADSGRFTEDGEFIPLRVQNYLSTLSGSFQISAPWSDGHLLSIDVSLDYEGRSEDVRSSTFAGQFTPEERGPFAWQNGTLVITARDGSMITAQPVISGVEPAWAVSVSGVELASVPWSDGYTVDCRAQDLCGVE